MPKKALNTPFKAPSAKAAPAGEPRDYFFYRGESVAELGEFQRINKVTLYFDGNTVYIPNDFGRVYYFDEEEPVYFTGTLSDDGTTITIQPKQKVGTYGGVLDFYIAKYDEKGESDEPIVLSYDQNSGLIYDATGEDVIYVTSESGYLCYSFVWQFIPTSVYTMSTRTFTGEGEEPNFDLMQIAPVEFDTTVEDYYSDVLGMHVVKGLFHTWADAYILVAEEENGDLTIGAQAIVDDEALLATTTDMSQISLDGVSTFTFDAANNTYTQVSGEMIMNAFVTAETPEGSFSYNANYTNLKLGAPTSSGINDITSSGFEKDAVSTQYFDLSGRRINGAEKGVSIKVMKFADGTSKAVKVMK